MKTCPKCFDVNSDGASQCKQCAAPLDGTAVPFSRNCPAGRHVMDPTWTVCAFCKAEGLVTDDMDSYNAYGSGGSVSAPRKTLFEGSPQAYAGGTAVDPLTRNGPSHNQGQPQARAQPSAVPYPPEAAPNPRKTRIDEGPPLSLQSRSPEIGGRNAGTERVSKTNFGGPGVAQAPSDQRRIVGILVTYSWKPEGQIFPVREGRNWIGRDRGADIVVTDDPTLSGVHSSITFHSRFTISDKDSMSGTFLNDVPVEVEKTALPNYARIRTGSTTWTFLVIDPTAMDILG